MVALDGGTFSGPLRPLKGAAATLFRATTCWHGERDLARDIGVEFGGAQVQPLNGGTLVLVRAVRE